MNSCRTRALLVGISMVVMVAAIVSGCASSAPHSLDEFIEQPISPAQHEKIADMYIEQAVEARATAVQHVARGKKYAAWSSGYGETAKRSAAMAEHCQHLARDYEDAAIMYEALAREHRGLARAGRETPDN